MGLRDWDEIGKPALMVRRWRLKLNWKYMTGIERSEKEKRPLDLPLRDSSFLASHIVLILQGTDRHLKSFC